MKTKISALMDGELERREAGGAIDALRQDGEVRETWRTYHLISDSMRDTRLLSGGFAARVAARLAQEPTVLAPHARPVFEQRRWQALSVAASLAAVAFVSVAYFQQDGADSTPPVAQVAPQAVQQIETAQVAPPEAANDYLLAHQGYSPRNSLQGMAPYVRTVAAETRGPKK